MMKPGYFYFLWEKFIHPDVFKPTIVPYVKALDYSFAAVNFFLANGPGLLLRYPLSETSVVYDVGGFTGNWSEKMIERYNPRIHIFEPNPKSYEILKAKFAGNPKAHTYSFGLAGRSREEDLYVFGMGSSIYKKKKFGSCPVAKVYLQDIKEVVKASDPGEIDLISINIEGGEYELLERMISAGIIGMVKNIQVQFHKFYPGAIQSRKILIKRLAETHRPAWSFPFVWEGWTRRP